jgi:peptidoglycan-N-acetylglucosamine deacetylase
MAHVLDDAGPGSIVLLHPTYDGREETREAIQPIIRGLKQNGYRFVTVSELLEGSD